MFNEKENKLGLSMSTLFILALLATPRVIAHDLKWLESGSFANMLLVFVPPLIWLVVVLLKTIKPFKALLFIGMFYGILLGITHQIFWNVSFDESPTLGGNLSDIPPIANAIIIRTFAFFSSLITGTVVGIITGLIGLLINRFRKTR